MHSDRDFAGCFRLEDYMKRKALSIFYKRRSAIKKDEPRSRSQSGLVYRQTFFAAPSTVLQKQAVHSDDDFYREFDRRLRAAKKQLGFDKGGQA